MKAVNRPGDRDFIQWIERPLLYYPTMETVPRKALERDEVVCAHLLRPALRTVFVHVRKPATANNEDPKISSDYTSSLRS